MASQQQQQQQRDFDVIVFGASGFTGQFVVAELAKTIQDENLAGALPSWPVAKARADRLGFVILVRSSPVC